MQMLYDKELRVFWTLCGSDGNNAYLIICPKTNESIIIDAPLGPEKILEQAKSTNVRAILITHRHSDHLEGLNDIKKVTGAPVVAHFEDSADMPIVPDILVNDCDVIKAGTVDVNVIHTPGHTPGSVCYLAANHLFTGDTLYAQSPGETKGVEATQQILRSITEKIFLLPDETFILPGHGRGSTIRASKELYRAFAAQYPDLLSPIP